MPSSDQSLRTLQDIKSMMERSSRFISLSGWSGVSAGICALVGAWLAATRIAAHKSSYDEIERGPSTLGIADSGLALELLLIAIGVFVAAFVLAFLFTYIKSKRAGIAIWGSSAMRLMWNTVIPMVTGGFVILRMLQLEYYQLIAPCCLIFYGLALVNGSKYTLGEVRYMGYGQILLGICNLWLLHWGLAFWAAGFGVLHIFYGALMWWKYERNQADV
ncbi:MAG: hypothetical protein INR73_22625 [Williamsia sp.]|nr:hypothetical protein [Williamsia sp.]